MSTITSSTIAGDWVVADLLDQLGYVPANRVLLHSTPGTATEQGFELSLHDLFAEIEGRLGDSQ
jgi:hypothetical protein